MSIPSIEEMQAEIDAQRSKPAKQYMFMPCVECNEFITHDLTDDTPSNQYEFIPLPIFEGDVYLAWFDAETWNCFPCSERTYDEFIKDSQNPKWNCDFVNGRGGWDCEGCERCNSRKLTKENGQPYVYFVWDK